MLFLASISVFVLLGLGFVIVPQLKDLYGDLSPDPDRIPAVMELNRFFEAIHLPLWTLAVAGLGVDLGVWSELRRRGRVLAAFNWLWAVTSVAGFAGVVEVIAFFNSLII